MFEMPNIYPCSNLYLNALNLDKVEEKLAHRVRLARSHRLETVLVKVIRKFF